MKSLKMFIVMVGISALIAGCSDNPLHDNQGADSISASQQINQNKTAVDSVSKAVFGGSSVSLAHSYESLEELVGASALIAEVQITGIHSTDKEIDSTFYNAVVTDVLKGTVENEDLVLTQLGIEDVQEKSGELVIQRENPLMKSNNNYILFLKAGMDDKVGPVYYVAGEYQGKYQIDQQKVFSVNQETQTKATVDGEDVNQFKSKIKEIVKAD